MVVSFFFYSIVIITAIFLSIVLLLLLDSYERNVTVSLDAMYYDYDAIIIIIIFITIHTTDKVKYTDIRNFIDDAFLYFIPSQYLAFGESDGSPSVVKGCNRKFRKAVHRASRYC